MNHARAFALAYSFNNTPAQLVALLSIVHIPLGNMLLVVNIVALFNMSVKALPLRPHLT
jgi:hypothetical protein